MAKAAAFKSHPADNKMVVSTRVSAWSLLCLVLLLHLEIAGAGTQEFNFQLLQPQEAVWVAAGETLTLICSQRGDAPVGPVKWFKDSGSGRQLIYIDKGSFPRVSRTTPGSNTDFTISITDTRPQDTGTYRCVRFQKVMGGDVEFSSGPGTRVSVSARPSTPSVSGPPSRAEPGSPVTFTCTSKGFFPRDITVTWLKNGVQLPAPPPQVLPGQGSVSYHMSSTVGVTLTRGDVRSHLTCQIQHSSLSDPLRGTYSLSNVLRVPPRLRVATVPTLPIVVNRSVRFTCSVQQFYPQSVSLTWLENGREMDQGHSSSLAESPDGTYTLQSLLEINATERRNQSVFTCQVVHDSQPPIRVSETLRIYLPIAEPGKGPTTSSPDQDLFAGPGLLIGLFLEKVLMSAFLLFLLLRKKK